MYDTNLSGLASLGQSFGDSPECFLMSTRDNDDEGYDHHDDTIMMLMMDDDAQTIIMIMIMIMIMMIPNLGKSVGGSVMRKGRRSGQVGQT